jgi:carboxyl-terminal processing protease
MRIGRHWGISIAFIVVVSHALGGCSGRAVPPETVVEQPFAADDALNMFKAVYAAIADRYIEPIPIENVAINGLTGFSDLDASLAVERVRNVVELNVDGRAVASESTPKARDVEGWAKVTVRLWRAARTVSPKVAAASSEDVYEAILDRATKALDPYSRYASAAEARRNRQRRDGYNGVGVGVRIVDGEPEIVEITGGGPAERAGLRVGDVLTHVDGRAVSDLSAEAISARLQDDPTGWVRMTVRRDGRGVLRFVVLRSYLIPDTVKERYEDGALFIAISHFNHGTADSIADTLNELRTGLQGRLRGVVLDLRGNPGGLLQQSIKTVDLFLSSGPILTTRGRHPDSDQSYTASGEDRIHGLPVVVLIDGNSASAAELVAKALQDRHRAIVVGSNSYGKGIVQTVVPLPNGGELSFTWSQAVPPSGEDIRNRGVRPDVCTSGIYVEDADAVDRVLKRGLSVGNAPSDLGCPAEQRAGAFDQDVAYRAINDAALYSKVLHHEPIVAAAPTQPAP